MTYRLIEVAVPSSREKTVCSALDRLEDALWWQSENTDGQTEFHIITPTNASQSVIDPLQSILTSESNWRMIILPVEAALFPGQKDVDPDDAKDKKNVIITLREEIYQDVQAGANISRDFLALTILSSIVAAIGINTDNVAVVIGAMVIAPLLGPLVAFSFASALGDIQLMLKSSRTALAGLAVGFGTALLLSSMIGVDLDSVQLNSRAVIGLDSVALALASGAAAALSILTGLSTALVGVMVAVALLPPSVAIALFLGAGEMQLAGRAVLLLVTNIVSVNIASQLVFALKGVRPRTWLEQRSAKKSRQINLLVWSVLLTALVVIISLL